jgi:tRNA threonylcarbamoyladenosine biosynthesis protein TsaE
MAYELMSDGPDETAAIARALAPALRPGDILLLDGELAAGKTTFVKAVAAALGSADQVTSPTFTLANFYGYPGGTILHIDAYRLSGLLEFHDLALEDYLESAVTLIEWGAFAAAEYPDHLAVRFAADPDADDRRVLGFAATSPRWRELLPDLRDRMLAELRKVAT